MPRKPRCRKLGTYLILGEVICQLSVRQIKCVHNLKVDCLLRTGIIYLFEKPKLSEEKEFANLCWHISWNSFDEHTTS